MSNIIINQATIHDLDELSSLFNSYRIFYNQESNLAGARQFLFDRFEHRESVIFLARESKHNMATGFTQLYPSFSSVSMQRCWILNDLFVLECYRGKGIASLLLNAAKEYAIQTKAKGLELSTAVDNIQAQRIYEGLEYKKDDSFVHYFLQI